jgi:hypothetical protein
MARLLKHFGVACLAVACGAGWALYARERSAHAEDQRQAEGNLRLLAEKAAYGMRRSVERSREDALGGPPRGPQP